MGGGRLGEREALDGGAEAARGGFGQGAGLQGPQAAPFSIMAGPRTVRDVMPRAALSSSPRVSTWPPEPP